MINIDTKNKLEHLEKKVEELERQLKEKTTLETTVREMEKRLTIYEDKIRSDKGELTLKKNFVIKNRKGKIPGGESRADNTALMYFNDQRTEGSNSIIIGSASADGFRKNSLVSIEAVQKDEIPSSTSNGKIQMFLLRGDQKPEEAVANFAIGDLRGYYSTVTPNSIPDEDGVFVSIVGTDDGEAALEYYNYSTGGYHAISATKNGMKISSIPTTDPAVAGVIYSDAGTLKISSG